MENIQLKGQIHENIMPLLEAMFLEFKELSKKNPTSAVSNQKIKIVNRLLHKSLEILKDEDTAEFLDILDEDDVPQLSDVVLILSQYVASMQAFRSKYYVWDHIESTYFWR